MNPYFARTEGGGLFYAGQYFYFIECSWYNNTAGQGGGLFNYYYLQPSTSSPTSTSTHLTNCSIVYNQAIYGGGFFSYEADLVQYHLSGVVINNNAAVFGGGVYAYEYATTRDNFLFLMCGVSMSGNRAFSQGGAVFVENLYFPISSSCPIGQSATNSITDNWSGGGGGAVSSNGMITDWTYSGCDISGNKAAYGDNFATVPFSFKFDAAPPVSGISYNGTLSLTGSFIDGDSNAVSGNALTEALSLSVDTSSISCFVHKISSTVNGSLFTATILVGANSTLAVAPTSCLVNIMASVSSGQYSYLLGAMSGFSSPVTVYFTKCDTELVGNVYMCKKKSHTPLILTVVGVGLLLFGVIVVAVVGVVVWQRMKKDKNNEEAGTLLNSNF